MKLVTKPLLNAVTLVVLAGAVTIVPAVGATGQSNGLPGTDNALNRLSEMKIRHAVLAESLKNIQIEAQIKSVEKKMNGVAQGVSSERIPVVSLLTCSGANHCDATLLLPNGARVSAYPGTVIGNGLAVVGVTEQGVLAESGAHRFYLPFAGDVTGATANTRLPAGSPAGSAGVLPPPVFGGTPMNATTPPAGMLPQGMLPAGMQSSSNFPGGTQ
ncbi:MAG: hypothetical protein ACYDB0_02750 [Acidithiobacillus sp.]